MNARHKRIVHLSTRIYGWLLSAYPRAHRRRYRTQMLQTFSDLICDTIQKRGAWGLLSVWMAMLVDTGSNALTEHVAERSAYMGMLKQWVARKITSQKMAWKTSTEKFDPFWCGFFMGIVSSMMTAAGAIMIYFDGSGSVASWLGGGLIAGAALGFAVQMLQKREYDKWIALQLGQAKP